VITLKFLLDVLFRSSAKGLLTIEAIVALFSEFGPDQLPGEAWSSRTAVVKCLSGIDVI
jgi:hypothetical protein